MLSMSLVESTFLTVFPLANGEDSTHAIGCGRRQTCLILSKRLAGRFAVRFKYERGSIKQ
jgi:hypothetical protein